MDTAMVHIEEFKQQQEIIAKSGEGKDHLV